MSNSSDNKLVDELESLKISFTKTADKIIKDINRQDKIMARSDKRQRQEYDELQKKLIEVQSLQEAQKELMDSFIKLIASAIDAKSKYTGGHCSRVPELSLMIAQAASDSTDEAFKEFEIKDDVQLRELSIAAWLHDCGKVTTPEYVVDKATKLETIYNRIHEIRTRFEVLYRDLKIEALEKMLAGEDETKVASWLDSEYKKLQDDFDFLANANIGGEFMNDADQKRVEDIANRTWERYFDSSKGLARHERERLTDDNSSFPVSEKLLSNKAQHIIPREDFDFEEYEKFGFKTPVPKDLYNLGEVYNLQISRGTLTQEERFKIQEHVIMSIKMLEELPFPDQLKNVPLFAGAHHETLIGTGYPRELKKEDMPLPARIMALADVFEALTAADRPYKEAKTLSASIKILSFMVKDKHLDEDIFKLFLSSGIYKEYAKLNLSPNQIDDVDISVYL